MGGHAFGNPAVRSVTDRSRAEQGHKTAQSKWSWTSRAVTFRRKCSKSKSCQKHSEKMFPEM